MLLCTSIICAPLCICIFYHHRCYYRHTLDNVTQDSMWDCVTGYVQHKCHCHCLRGEHRHMQVGTTVQKDNIKGRQVRTSSHISLWVLNCMQHIQHCNTLNACKLYSKQLSGKIRFNWSPESNEQSNHCIAHRTDEYVQEWAPVCIHTFSSSSACSKAFLCSPATFRASPTYIIDKTQSVCHTNNSMPISATVNCMSCLLLQQHTSWHEILTYIVLAATDPVACC